MVFITTTEGLGADFGFGNVGTLSNGKFFYGLGELGPGLGFRGLGLRV